MDEAEFKESMEKNLELLFEDTYESFEVRDDGLLVECNVMGQATVRNELISALESQGITEKLVDIALGERWEHGESFVVENEDDGVLLRQP